MTVGFCREPNPLSTCCTSKGPRLNCCFWEAGERGRRSQGCSANVSKNDPIQNTDPPKSRRTESGGIKGLVAGLSLHAWPERVEGRKVYLTASIQIPGKVEGEFIDAIRANALFVRPRS
ncbi:hypothetical protein BDV37DRAFT_52901 [Aspergillus pseudonomiae]|uniref:Uncharacterized protein n=1 Tax=Aspergillus pseudonomiae TaxID=1506151 RepID=A0A5N7DK21_9EURO|nr:uncharacterized protein BDV37DRAFT_52901 [Aspergillus pseudonomiae]KAE8406786.1 hypothetical protein BDV37DRAFT_52901 [Aspergillus pseudonomiae]